MTRWIPPDDLVEVNPPEDIRDDGRVGSMVAMGIVIVGAIVSLVLIAVIVVALLVAI